MDDMKYSCLIMMDDSCSTLQKMSDLSHKATPCSLLDGKEGSLLSGPDNWI
jgi:hypothetical protein